MEIRKEFYSQIGFLINKLKNRSPYLKIIFTDNTVKKCFLYNWDWELEELYVFEDESKLSAYNKGEISLNDDNVVKLSEVTRVDLMKSWLFKKMDLEVFK